MSDCTSVAVSPDLFIVDPMNCVIAVANPLVPAVDCIMELPPPIMPPPMVPVVIDVPPILPFMMPSDASFIMAAIIPDELVMPMLSAYWDMAANVIP